MPFKRKCCVTDCHPEDNISYHNFPATFELNLKWKNILEIHTDVSSLSEHALVCSKHFTNDSFLYTDKRKLLIAGALPTIFESVDQEKLDFCDDEVLQISCIGTQTKLLNKDIQNHIYTNKCLTQKLKRLRVQDNRIKQDLTEEKEKSKKDADWKALQQIKSEATEMNPQATFIIDQIRNYKKKIPRWSENTIRHCIAWRFCSAKGYEFPRNSFMKLPCKTTLQKYLGTENKNLIKDRLLSEINVLSAPERVCSLILDDMTVKESVSYSKTEDRVFGLETISHLSSTIGDKPIVANQLLCYVIHGMSTKFVIPASYYFHRQLNSKNLHKITLDVLKQLAECGFKVIWIVADNHKYHVALFRHFGNGKLQNFVPHPYNPGLQLFLSFDYCHAIKNARNLFLDHDMASEDGVISGQYLKDLAEIQNHLVIKPVRYLTKKHFYPSNLEKMKVNLAVQLFSPKVTAPLKYLLHYGGAEYVQFQQCSATIEYMENMYKYFQIHDVSNKTQHVHQNDPNTAPYTRIQDERLSWLDSQFPQYIADIQSCSTEAGLTGLTKETAEALVFTAKSTSLCVQYLIRDLNFYYVLTRSFSSDAVESVFANIRLRGGSNDLTDCRAAEYALRQILKSGFIKNVFTSNVKGHIQHDSTVDLISTDQENFENEITVTLSDSTINKIEQIRSFERKYEGFLPIESGAIAFLTGYLLMKIKDCYKCEICLSVLEDKSPQKRSPLLDLSPG